MIEIEFSVELKDVHRLDRMTSGLLIFAKNSQTCASLQNSIKNNKAIKIYLARVKGKFPASTIICDKPMKCADKKIGKNVICSEFDDLGKKAITEFNLFFYDSNSNTSIIKCKIKR